MSDPKILGMPMMGELPTKAEPSRLVINSCPTDSMPTSIAEYIEEARERRAGGQRLVSANEIAKQISPGIRSKILTTLDQAGEEKGIIGRVANFVREKAAGRKSPLSEEDMKRADGFYQEYKYHCSRRITTLPQQKCQVGEAILKFATDLGERYDYVEIEPELAALLSMATDLVVPIHQWSVNAGYVQDQATWNKMGRPNLGLAVAPGTPTRAGDVGKIHDPILNAAKEVVGYQESDRSGQGAFMAPTIELIGGRAAKVSHPGDEQAIPIRTEVGAPAADTSVPSTQTLGPKETP